MVSKILLLAFLFGKKNEKGGLCALQPMVVGFLTQNFGCYV